MINKTTMKMQDVMRKLGWVLAFVSTLGWQACDDDDDDKVSGDITLVAESEKRWTGVAVSQQSRIFANYPNWSADHTVSVVEVANTALTPYPDVSWNTWMEGLNPADHFICVQSVYVDNDNFLWILDPANPQREGEFLGVVPGGAKLLKIDLSSNTVVQKIIFTEPIIEKNSYLNDVRIDEDKQIGYITDSNEGAIVVVNLVTGEARRLLATDPSTKSENEIINVEGTEYRNQQGEYPNIHADGIALSPGKGQLYWRPLTGRSLYSIETSLLNDASVTPATLSAGIKNLGDFPPSDGMIFGADDKLYLTSIEENGVRVYNDVNSSTLVRQSGELKWPDSFAVGPDGFIYVTTSQLHLQDPQQPFRIYKFKPN